MKREIAQTDTNFSDLQGKLTGQVFISSSQVLQSVSEHTFFLFFSSFFSQQPRLEPVPLSSVARVSDGFAVTETEQDRAIWKSCRQNIPPLLGLSMPPPGFRTG